MTVGSKIQIPTTPSPGTVEVAVNDTGGISGNGLLANPLVLDIPSLPDSPGYDPTMTVAVYNPTTGEHEEISATSLLPIIPVTSANEGTTLSGTTVQLEIDNLTRTTTDVVGGEIQPSHELALTEGPNGDYKATVEELTDFASANVFSKFQRQQGDFTLTQTTINLAYKAINPENFFILYINSQPATYGIDYTVSGSVVTLTGASYPILNTYVWEVMYLRGVEVPPPVFLTKLYTANNSSNNVTVLDASDYSNITTIPGVTGGIKMASWDGFLAVNGGPGVFIINTDTDTVEETISATSFGYGIAYGNNKLGVARGPNALIVDTNASSIQATILRNEGGFPVRGVAFGNNKFLFTGEAGSFLPDGLRAIRLRFVDASTNNVTSSFLIEGNIPRAIAYGVNEFVVGGSDNSFDPLFTFFRLHFLDAVTENVITSIDVGFSLIGAAYGMGKFVCASNSGNIIIVVDAVTRTLISTIPLAGGPLGVTFGNGTFVITNSTANAITVLDGNTLDILDTAPVGTFPGGVAFGI